MAQDQGAPCRCVTFHLRSAPAGAEEVAPSREEPPRVPRIEAYIAASRQAIPNLTDVPRLAVKRFVSR
jgi:hypothetical protein